MLWRGCRTGGGPASRMQPHGEAGPPPPCCAADGQAPKELLSTGDVINNEGHASDFYL